MFICLAENLSFTKAAKLMYVSQSTLSNKIAELESQLGVNLLERTTRSVSLTPAGEYFLEECRVLVRRFDAMTARTREIATGDTGNLSVGFLDLVGAEVVETAIIRFCQKYPNVNLQLSKANYTALLKSALNMDLDIVFVMTDELGDSSPVIAEPLLSGRMKVLMNEAHPLAQRRSLKIAELKDEPLLVVDNTLSKEMTKAIRLMFGRQGIQPNIVRECAGPEELSIYVAAGHGIGIVSSFFSVAQERLPQLKMIPLSHITETRNLYILHHASNSNNCIKPFLAEAREVASKFTEHDPDYVRPKRVDSAV